MVYMQESAQGFVDKCSEIFFFVFSDYFFVLQEDSKSGKFQLEAQPEVQRAPKSNNIFTVKRAV